MNRLDEIDPAELGERLRKARSAAGRTQEEAATVVGVARTTLVAVERGQRRIRAEELVGLGRFYRVSINGLLKREAVHVDFSARFRKLPEPNARSTGEDEAVRILTRLATASVELEKLLGKPPISHYPPEQPIERGDVSVQAEETALALRHRLGIGLAPVGDIVSLMELELGIRVFVRPLPSKISGLFAFDETVGACVLINANHPRNRRVATAAHELGHFMTNRSDADVVDEHCDMESRDERFAVAFGAAFLMPAPSVRRRYREIADEERKFAPRHLILMAHVFGVSTEAMCRRLEKMELIKQGAWDSLKARGFGGKEIKQVLGDPQPEEPSLVLPPRLSLLAAEAYQRGLQTEEQLCEKLAMDRIEVRKLLDEFASGDVDGLSFGS